MGNHAEYGRAAMRAGSPDYGQNDLVTDAGDAIANILHACAAAESGDDPIGLADDVIARARLHFDAEITGSES